MTSPRPTDRRRLVAGLLRVVLAAGVVPLLVAPTCGTMAPGLKSFARRSLIIPMDVCYQNTSDDLRRDSNGTGYTPTSCPQAKDNGDVIRAYGLVYQLVRNNIAVYWVINPAKTSTTDIDFSLQYNNGPPAYLYNWAGGGVSTSTPTTGTRIDYRGGPFVVDGSDFDRAVAVLNTYRTTFQNVNVHVANVAFQAEVAKTMAGGWSAGGTVPPKLALLDIGSDGAGSKNSEPVIRGYLTRAGLDTPGAAGRATGTHGQIFDRLVMDDFIPSTPGDWTTTRLYQNGYQILWVPHWVAPNSCSDCTGSGDATCPCNIKYGSATVAQALATIGAFYASGKDVFAECAGLASFEGVFGDESTANHGGTDYPGTGGWDTRYRSGHAATHFQTETTPGFWINEWPSGTSTRPASVRTGFSSPLTQIGDFTFVALFGAINNYRAHTYRTGVTRYITYDPDPNFDIFTMIAPTGGRGTAVYLGGHSYSGTDGDFQVAGSRLVLNTLFNLGASCQETGVACSTGELGECAQGVMSCTAEGQPYCRRLHEPAAIEACDGRDNNCNGLVDELIDTLPENQRTIRPCYNGPAATRGVGTCQDGISSCIRRADGTYGMSECLNQVLPTAEICNGLNDDCDKDTSGVELTDEKPDNTGTLEASCYTGPASSLDPVTGNPRGICKAGISACSGGVWGDCATCAGDAWMDRDTAPDECQILPRAPQDCENFSTLDMNCSGTINCGCTNGATQTCYNGPPGTLGEGICVAGTRTCRNGSWDECEGGQTPLPRDCSSHADNDCNGQPDDMEDECNLCPLPTDEESICRVPGIARDVEGNPTAGSACKDGVRACKAGVLGGCSGMVFPAAELCDDKDNNCDGTINENPTTLCGPDFTCLNGVCVPAQCGVENDCPSGYTCNVDVGACVLSNCGASPCPLGQICEYGVSCKNPCTGVTCGDGASCSTGNCTGGGCYLTGCATGQTCQQGTCVADRCSGVACPVGTFCRAGDCVQSCVYVDCPSNQVCSADGFCETDRCADAPPCATGRICVINENDEPECVEDLCAGMSCGARQICKGGVCEDDPCNSTTCPVGACNRGQCFPAMDPDDPDPGPSPSGGCGAGQPGGLSALLLLALLPLVLGRRTPARATLRARRPAHRAALLGLAALLAASAQACKDGDSSVDLSTCTHVCEGENRCIDLVRDPGHCGSCETVCGSGEQCVDGVCGPTGYVAPQILSADPGEASPGLLDPLTVTLRGERFALGDDTTVRVTSLTGSRTYRAQGVCPSGMSPPCPVASSTSLRFDLDLSEVGRTVLELRVVNPDRVISNARRFSVRAVAPNLTDVTPSSVNTGSRTTLRVTGSGFSSGSVCHLAPTCHDDVNGFGLPTTTSGGGLDCVLDAAGLQPGGYRLWVENDGAERSSCRDLTVTSATPTILSLSPSSGQTGSPVDIVITGTGFDMTSAVHFVGPETVNPLTTYVDSGRLFVSQLLLATTGSYTVTVTNGSQQSTCPNGPASCTFTSLPNPPSVDNLSVTPSPTYQGSTITLTFTGNGLGTANGITIVPPTPPSFAATLGTVNDGSVTGTAALGTRPDGIWNAYVNLPAGNSSTFSFRVLSNVAVLSKVSPGGDKQGLPVTVTLTASNLRGGLPDILLRGPLQSSVTPVTRTTTATAVTATTASATLDLSGHDTGVYGISVRNPGAATSNEVTFSVQPGTPTLTSVTPSCVFQTNEPWALTIAGTNFALPDAQGNGFSQMMYSVDQTNWFPVPATVTVVDHDTITASFDARNAVPNATGYSLSIWNPGPLKSVQDVRLRVYATACP